MDWQVELRPLAGKQATAAGVVEIQHDIDLVLVKLKRGLTQVGSLPHKGDRVLFLAPTFEKGDFFLVESQRSEINRQALELRERLRNPQPEPAATDGE